VRKVLVESGDVKYAQSIAVGPYRLTADESVAVGGAEQGPNPHELLLAALGACTGITMRMYAEHKQWPLHGTRIELAHSRASGVDEIDASISLVGELSDEQRHRLLEIAAHCPIHRALVSGARVRLALTD
jgi:putative redox protein